VRVSTYVIVFCGSSNRVKGMQ